MSKEIWLRLIGSLLTAIGIGVQELRQSRDAYGRRKLARAEATEMVAFIEKWIQTQQLTCLPEEFEAVKRRAQLQLECVYATLTKVNEAKLRAVARPLFQRIFLLYKPQGVGGWITHIAFYLLLFLLAMGSVGALSEEEPTTWFDKIAVFGFYFVVLLIVRAVAVHIDTKRHQQTGSEAVSAPPISTA
jgi:hypothetical protein